MPERAQASASAPASGGGRHARPSGDGATGSAGTPTSAARPSRACPSGPTARSVRPPRPASRRWPPSRLAAQAELDEINAMCDGHFERATAGDKAADVAEAHRPQPVERRRRDEVAAVRRQPRSRPRRSARGPDGHRERPTAWPSRASPTSPTWQAWKADPLGNLLKSAADIATGITIILGSIVALATAIIAIMWALAIVTFGALGPAAAVVTPICTTIISTVFPWSLVAAKWALALQALTFIKNLADAATAKTAGDLQTNSEQMTEDAKQGGAMAATIVVAKGMEVGGKALANTAVGQRGRARGSRASASGRTSTRSRAVWCRLRQRRDPVQLHPSRPPRSRRHPRDRPRRDRTRRDRTRRDGTRRDRPGRRHRPTAPARPPRPRPPGRDRPRRPPGRDRPRRDRACRGRAGRAHVRLGGGVRAASSGRRPRARSPPGRASRRAPRPRASRASRRTRSTSRRTRCRWSRPRRPTTRYPSREAARRRRGSRAGRSSRADGPTAQGCRGQSGHDRAGPVGGCRGGRGARSARLRPQERRGQLGAWRAERRRP